MLKKLNLPRFRLLNERSQPLLHVRGLNFDIRKKKSFLGLLKVSKIKIAVEIIFFLLLVPECLNSRMH